MIVPLLLYAAACAAFLVASDAARSDFPLDDAWIHQVYARAFAQGQGLAYNEGAQEAGATSPLWAIANAPVHGVAALLGPAAVPWGAKLLGVGLGAAAIVALFLVAGTALQAAWAAAAAASLLALEPRLIFSALSGMETALLLALWLGAVAAVLRQRRWLALTLFGLAPLARPEALVLLGLALPAWALLQGRRPWWRSLPRGGRRAATAGALALLAGPTLGWSLFCHAVNGGWLPNTYYLKAHSFSLGASSLRTLWALVVQHGWLGTIAGAAGLGTLAIWIARGLRRHHERGWIAATLGAAPGAYLLGVVGSRDLRLDGYYWTRWVDPPLLVVVAAAGLGLAALARWGLTQLRAAAPTSAARWPALVALAAPIVLVLASAPRLAESLRERRDRLASDSRAIRKINVEPAQWIAAHVPAEAVVGVNDAGAMRYFGQRRTLDLGGLNYAPLAMRHTTLAAVAEQLDWLAVFPAHYAASGLLDAFEPVKWFSIPPAEYTICQCPSQTVVAVAQRKRPPPPGQR
ncbi:MAG: hypothetical protein IPL40_02440 [Proteobacteria bacterium]|nr:hypothetical protein [Pseudomonadota bacterium]